MNNYILKYGDTYHIISKEKVITVKGNSDLCDSDYKHDYTSEIQENDLDKLLTKIRSIIGFIDDAEDYKKNKEYEKASISFEKAAALLELVGDEKNACDCYAYAAIMKENSEKWRSISFLWYKASGKMKSIKDYTDFNSLQHTYPTISIERWKQFSEKEKIGRAIQYAAYSEDNYGGPTDSYWLYEEAVHAYKDAGINDRMIECLISATNRYVNQYNKVSDSLILLWKDVLKDKQTPRLYGKLIILAFDEIYKKMDRNESEKAVFFYIESKKMQTVLAFAEHQYLKGIKGICENLFSDYGTNVLKVIIQVLVIVLGLFPLIFMFLDDCMSFKSALICSVNNFMGIEYVGANNSLYFAGIFEVLYSYFILVVISTYVINKVVRSMN